MSLDEFSCVVLGDEPAGLWLLGRYASELKKQGTEGRFGYISFAKPPAQVLFPRALASQFNLEVGPGWSAEVIAPERSLVWQKSSIRAEFPDLPKRFFDDVNLDGLLRPSGADLAALRHALVQAPELLCYAQAIWKRMGRAYTLPPEKTILGALLCRELSFWNAHGCLPESTQQVAIQIRENPLESVKSLRSGALALHFTGNAPIASQKWILNMSFQDLELLSAKSADLVHLLGLSAEPRSRCAFFPFPIQVGTQSVPTPVRPLTVYCDTLNIPDFDSEIWPLDLRRYDSKSALNTELTVWTSADRLTSLDAVLDGFKKGLARLNRLFPFLGEEVKHLPFPLEMENCFSTPDRVHALNQLESSVVEAFDLTGFSSTTRSPALFSLLPHLHCYLPYPLGPLLAARHLLPELVGRPKKKAPPPKGPRRSAGTGKNAASRA